MKKLIILCMFICIVGSSLQAQLYYSLFEPAVVDARSSALGRTTVLTTFGSNAVFTNPANLGMLDKQYFQAGARAIFGSRKTEYKEQGEEDYESSYLFHPKFNHVSYAMPYNIPNSGIKTVFAAGYRTYYDYGYTYYHEYDDEYDDKSSYEYTYKHHGGFNTLTLGAAANFNDKIFGGLAYNIGIMSKTSYWVDENGQDEDGDLWNMKGSFLTVGGIFKPTDRISLGLTFTPGFEYEIEWDESGHTDDIDIPSQLALSAMFELSESFTGIIEYQNRPWKNYEVDGDEFYGDIDNGMCLRAGVEFSKMLRLGFFSNSVPITDTNSSGESEDKPLSQVGFTGGIGLNVSPQMILYLSGEYSFINIEDNEYDYQSETKISIFKFGATFTYILL